ncbi:MAG: isoprenylcysteine carboxylmethyltransferase family protein [Planctomycetia bacterium]|nr:isoprenylcysteine carboxylmethyltransferase family protein [Planctomycetia bacterium]
MTDDHIFQIVLFAGCAVMLPIGLYYRIRSQATGEKLDRRQEGLFVLLTLRPMGVVRMLGLIAYMVNPAWMAWSSCPLPTWLRWLGVPIGAAAATGVIWTFHTLGPNLTDTVAVRQHATLVTSGPYRWIRHPFYASFALAATADSLVTANWFLALTGILTFSLIVLRIRAEEARLLARFGGAYRSYMRTTGRFWPRGGL